MMKTSKYYLLLKIKENFILFIVFTFLYILFSLKKIKLDKQNFCKKKTTK